MQRDRERPNLLLLMADQHRWDALGCVTPTVQTPALDALAARGVRCTQAVCNAPLCVPSRYSLMTGLYPSQNGVRHNTQMCPTDADLPVPVLAQRLRDIGYQTAGFGKTHWYIGGDITPDIPTIPSTRGFAIRAEARPVDPLAMEPGATNMATAAPAAYARVRAEMAPFGRGGESALGYTGRTSAIPAGADREGWLTEQALAFLDGGRDPDRPFFLYLSFDFPHAGFNVPAGYEDRYDLEAIPDRPAPPWADEPAGHVPPSRWAADWRAKTPRERRRTTLRYYALCSYVDDLFGRVLRRLDELGERDDTLILFTSDHGEMLGDRGHRFSKYCLYDGSVRVPLIVAGVGIPPGRAGTTDDRPAELVDILPTLLAAAGGPGLPELPGRSLLDAPCRAGQFAELHGGGYEPVQVAPAYMWRTREWKLILSLPGVVADAGTRLGEARGELYDLRADPHEWTNLYDDRQYLATRERLTRELLLHLATVWARYPRQAARAAL